MAFSILAATFILTQIVNNTINNMIDIMIDNDNTSTNDNTNTSTNTNTNTNINAGKKKKRKKRSLQKVRIFIVHPILVRLRRRAIVILYGRCTFCTQYAETKSSGNKRCFCLISILFNL